MSKIRNTILFVAILLSAACERVVEFDADDIERMVVVNGLPCTDSTLFVNITYSRFFLDNQAFVPVDNAIVTVDVNGTTIASSTRDGANYYFNYTAAAGDTMTLSVSVPGHDEVRGGTRFPALPCMTTPTAEIDSTLPITAGVVSFTLSDPSKMENYYNIYVMERDSGSQWNQWEARWDTIDTVIYSYFNCMNYEITSPEVNCTMGMVNYFNQLLFKDSLIDGKDYEITLSLIMLKDTAEHPLMRQYSLVVESLTPEAYQYWKEVMNAHGIGQYFAEPSRLFSNLHGGLGIFAALSRRVWPLFVE